MGGVIGRASTNGREMGREEKGSEGKVKWRDVIRIKPPLKMAHSLYTVLDSVTRGVFVNMLIHTDIIQPS